MTKKNNDNQEEKNQDSTEEAQKETPIVVEEKTAEEKLAELNDKYVRLYADFENFRKRMSKERIDLIKFASEEMFKQVIPVLDDFERAFKSMTDTTDINTIKQGEELIYNKFKNILTQ